MTWTCLTEVWGGRAGSNWDGEIGCNPICGKRLCYFIYSEKKNWQKHQRMEKNDLRHRTLTDIIQSFCRGPNVCVTPVYTSYCRSNLRLSTLWNGAFYNHIPFASRTANYLNSLEMCAFRLRWRKRLLHEVLIRLNQGSKMVYKQPQQGLWV